MKIAIATFTFPPNADGVSLASSNMATWFSQAGHEVHVFTSMLTHHGTLPMADGLDETSVHRYRANGSQHLASIDECSSYRGEISKFDPDIIIFHCWNTWPLKEILPQLERMKARTILLSHGFPTHGEIVSVLRKAKWWLGKIPLLLHIMICFKKLDRMVFLSRRQDFERFFDTWIADKSCHHQVSNIPNGVAAPLPTTPHGVFRDVHHLAHQTIFLCIANYSPRKNQRRALQAFCKASLDDAVLVFIGSSFGEYGRAVRAEWEAMKEGGASGEVIFLEGVSREDTISALHDCDVFVLAADAETQPIVLLEAMAARKPFISTDTGCVSEFRGGLVVQDADQMATAMRQLHGDAEKRAALASEGQTDFEQHYSEPVVKKAWLGLIEEIAQSR